MISELIDKQDNFEIIRDQIAYILVSEVANQMALATAAEKDPEDWRLKIYTERSNPWELFSDVKCTDPIPPPIVNIWYDNSSFDQKAGDVVSRQKSDTVYNIDCYGYGRSSDDGGTGHTAGDKSAALAVQKAIRLVRNILMAAEYTYLDLRGTVWQRWPQSITVFQPQIDSRTVQNIVGARVALRVTFNEFSPQVEGNLLELLSISVTRAEDGEIYLETDYNYKDESDNLINDDGTAFDASWTQNVDDTWTCDGTQLAVSGVSWGLSQNLDGVLATFAGRVTAISAGYVFYFLEAGGPQIQRTTVGAFTDTQTGPYLPGQDTLQLFVSDDFVGTLILDSCTIPV